MAPGARRSAPSTDADVLRRKRRGTFVFEARPDSKDPAEPSVGLGSPHAMDGAPGDEMQAGSAVRIAARRHFTQPGRESPMPEPFVLPHKRKPDDIAGLVATPLII